MRIIHCADVHLDSSMETILGAEKAARRREELLVSFARLVRYAAAHDVAAVLIAGDLFDSRNLSRHAADAVLDLFRQNPQIHFFYLRGNHDPDAFANLPGDGGGSRSSRDAEAGRESVHHPEGQREGDRRLPGNLHLFKDRWRSYSFESSRVRISGLELTSRNSTCAASSLKLNAEDFNIVMMHGQIAGCPSPDRAEMIALPEFRGKNIDYLALGHVHQHQEGVLEPGGMYVYPGCLEGRGFDEIGEHGFELLEIDESSGAFSPVFVPFAGRRVLELEAGADGAETSLQIVECVRRAAQNAPEKRRPGAQDYVKVVLTGELSEESEKNLDFIRMQLEEDFYAVRIEDRTSLRVCYEDYRYDPTLRGEFVRLVQAADRLSEEEKAEIVRCGLSALKAS